MSEQEPERADAPLVSVVVVAYQSAATLAQCLDALAAQTFRDFEILLVDNASADTAAEREAAQRQDLRFLPQTENIGFAAANNLAARIARGKWLALLNPDAFAKPDWLEELLAGAARHPDVRCFGSLQLRAGDETIMDGAGDVMTIAGIPYRGGYGRKLRPIPEGEIFSACAAAMLIDRALFLEHTGFDERFFCYCEDVDLGYRLRLANKRVMTIPKAIVAHVGGASSGVRNDFATYYGMRNRIWTYVKNTPPLLFWVALPLHIAITIALVAVAVRRGVGGAAVKGVCGATRSLGVFLSLRKLHHRKGSLGSSSILRVMDGNPIGFITRGVARKA